MQNYNQHQHNTGKLIEDSLNTILNFFIKQENIEKLAMFNKNYYDALVKNGFSKEDALDIVKSSNLTKKLIN